MIIITIINNFQMIEIGNDMDRIGRDLISGSIPEFAWRN
jgi:hypothetical protein